MTAGGVASVARWLFLMIDRVVYKLIENIALIFSLLSRGTVFTQEDINNVTNRVYMLVALIMLFRLAFSFINYIINPEQLTDSQKGGGKLVVKIVVSLSLLVLTPTIFNEAYRLQALIIDQDIIGKLVAGESYASGDATFGAQLSYNTFRTFYKISDSIYEQYCSGQQDSADCIAKIDDLSPKSMIGTSFATGDNDTNLDIIADVSFVTDKVVVKGPYTIVNADREEYIIDYQFGLSTITGIVVAYLLLCFCFDVAIRMVKLGFLQLIAPIPIVMSLAPGQDKKDPMSTWGKECFSTYISLFIRLMVIYLAFFIIQMMTDTAGHGIIDVVKGTNTTRWQGMLLNLFGIIGALLFAKEAPKLIEQLFGLNGMKLTLNPLKALRSTPVVGGAVIGATAAAGGVAAATLGATAGVIGAAGRGFMGVITKTNMNAGLHLSETGALFGAHLGAAGQGFVNHFSAGLSGNGKGASKGVHTLYNDNKNNIKKEYQSMYERQSGEKYYNQAEAYKNAGQPASNIFNSKDFAQAFDQANAAKDMMNAMKSQYQQAYDSFNAYKDSMPEGALNAEIERLDKMRIDAGKAEGIYNKAKAELDYQIKANPEDAKIYQAYSAADDRHSVSNKLNDFNNRGTPTPNNPTPNNPSSRLNNNNPNGPTNLNGTH